MESYFDLVFALNEQTYPGEKRLMQLCRETCAVLSENFEGNLNFLFSHMFAVLENVPSNLDRVLTALAKIL